MCTPNLLIYLLTFFRRSNILVLLHFKIHDILLCTSAVLGAVLERPKSVCMGIANLVRVGDQVDHLETFSWWHCLCKS